MRPADFKWRVTLAHDFIALETRAYESRQDFMERLETILQTLGETLAPTHMMRFGMRYIDQIKGEPMARIDTLLRKEVLGVAPCAGPDVRQVVTEFSAPAEPGELLARWGRLPATMTVDPNLLPPITEDSWLIDLDVRVRGRSRLMRKELLKRREAPPSAYMLCFAGW